MKKYFPRDFFEWGVAIVLLGSVAYTLHLMGVLVPVLTGMLGMTTLLLGAFAAWQGDYTRKENNQGKFPRRHPRR